MCKMGWAEIGHEKFENGGSVMGKDFFLPCWGGGGKVEKINFLLLQKKLWVSFVHYKQKKCLESWKKSFNAGAYLKMVNK